MKFNVHHKSFVTSSSVGQRFVLVTTLQLHLGQRFVLVITLQLHLGVLAKDCCFDLLYSCIEVKDW